MQSAVATWGEPVRLDKLMMVLVVLGSMTGVAGAENKAEPNPASADPAATAGSAQPAEAATAPAAEATPVVVRRVDPVEAALAQAMALSEAPAPKDPPAAVKGKGKRGDRGLHGLNKFARTAAKININAWTHSTRVPVHEPVVRMDVQSLSARQVSDVIKKNLRKLQYCHERLAARGGAPRGEVAVRFTVHPKGNPIDIQVTAGGANAKPLERCLVARIRAIEFPAADAPTEVSYPFVFDVVGSADAAAAE